MTDYIHITLRVRDHSRTLSGQIFSHSDFPEFPCYLEYDVTPGFVIVIILDYRMTDGIAVYLIDLLCNIGHCPYNKYHITHV